MSKEKKAWVRIIEAFVAVLIILTAVLIIVDKTSREKPKVDSIIYEKEADILEVISKNESLRGIMLNKDLSSGRVENIAKINEFIGKMIPSSWDFSTALCSIEDICNINTPSDKNVYADEIIITGNSTFYRPRKLKLFVWMK